MEAKTFVQVVEKIGPEMFVKQRLAMSEIPACAGPKAYEKFKEFASTFFGSKNNIFIMGSGNLGYSLNPIKNFRPFGADSDIDLVIVSLGNFQESWNEMRVVQRRTYYQLDRTSRERLLEFGKNVYCGFVSPEWIPDKGNLVRYRFLQAMNALSCELVGYRSVGARFFRNTEEVVDYYRRGVMIAMEKAK